MKQWLVLSCACLALGLVAAGCDGDDSDDAGESTTTSEQPANGSGAAIGGSVAVDIRDIEYIPRKITIEKGETIVWTNNDSVSHTVTKEAGAGPTFDSSDINSGETYEETFDTPGEIDYICTIHPSQKGKIIVR
jgi:plastocyanin